MRTEKEIKEVLEELKKDLESGDFNEEVIKDKIEYTEWILD